AADRRRRPGNLARGGGAARGARRTRGRVDARARHRARGRARNRGALRRCARRRALAARRRRGRRRARTRRLRALMQPGNTRMDDAATTSSADLAARIAALPRKSRLDLEGLVRAIEKREREQRPTSRLAAKLEAELAAAEAAAAARKAIRWRIEYPPELPIAQARELILDALDTHRVIVVCGDTGSGKTTQLPKLCLEAGRGTQGMIGHTQPRRIAARSVAQRLADELGVAFGGPVGYQVRFTDETDPTTDIKVMTDGILLNEIRHDRWLDAYDTLIIDEAHERSLNIDFLLGFLRRIEKKRPDLKIVITSATIDPERFAEHFGGAPILRVEGRTFPVDVRYRPLQRGEDLPQAVAAAAVELD